MVVVGIERRLLKCSFVLSTLSMTDMEVVNCLVDLNTSWLMTSSGMASIFFCVAPKYKQIFIAFFKTNNYMLPMYVPNCETEFVEPTAPSEHPISIKLDVRLSDSTTKLFRSSWIGALLLRKLRFLKCCNAVTWEAIVLVIEVTEPAMLLPTLSSFNVIFGQCMLWRLQDEWGHYWPKRL